MCPSSIRSRFVREFAEWCLEHGVRGKFSVVPCPAALGRIDEGLPLFSRAQQESWLQMCRAVITPAYDITPEMITHTVCPLIRRTCKPLESGIWEQYDWNNLPVDQEELVVDYITTACQILENVGLTPEGVYFPPVGSAARLDFLCEGCRYCSTRGYRAISTPYFFKRVSGDGPVENACFGMRIERPVQPSARLSLPPGIGPGFVDRLR